MTSPATTLQASNARGADVFQVHGFGVKSREEKSLWGQRSCKRRWLQGSSRCHSENPRFEDDKFRLRGTDRGSCPSRPLRQRARPTTPFRRQYPAQKLRRIKQRRRRSSENDFCSAAGRSRHRIRLDVGLYRRTDFCCLRGAAPHPVLS